jgi:hypothetical protein
MIDVSFPTAPNLLNNAYGGFDQWGVAASGSLAVATGNSVGLKVVDVSNPSAPRTVSSLSGTMRGVAMAGQYAYVLNLVPGNPSHTDLIVVNLTVPAIPAVVGRVTLAGGNSGIKVVGSLVYVAAGSAGLQVINVSNPSAPSIVNTIPTTEAALDLTIDNGYLYAAGPFKVMAFSLSNPQSPSLVGSLTVSSTALSFPVLAAANSRVYEIVGLSLQIIDVSSPSSPYLLSTSTSYSAQGINATGNTVFLTMPAADHFDTRGGVYVLDMSNATSPSLIKQVIVPGLTKSVAIAGSYAYAGDSAAIVDVITVP